MKVHLIHTKLQLGFTPLFISLPIRMVTCSQENHAGLFFDKHKQFWDSTQYGIDVCDEDEYLKKDHRIVSEYEVDLKMLGLTEDEVYDRVLTYRGHGYGYLDIAQVLLHIVRRNWLGIGNDWNGVSGVEKRPGIFCSEFVAKVLGFRNPHLWFPGTLKHHPALRYVRTFETKKSK